MPEPASPSANALIWAAAMLLAAVPAGLCAFSTTSEFSTNITTVTRLVDVAADLTFPPLVPGAQYAKNVSVTWALPQESLRDLTSQAVVVHVVAYADGDSWLSLVGSDGRRYRAYAFDLTCAVQGGRCGNDSSLSRTLQAVLAVPSNASANHAERLMVQASLADGFASAPLDNLPQGFAQDAQDAFQNIVVQPAAQLFRQSGGSAAPAPSATPDALRANDTLITLEANVTASSQTHTANDSIQLGGSASGSSTSGSNVQAGLLAQVAQQPNSDNQASEGIPIPLTGLVVAKADAVLYGGLIVFGLLGFLFYRHFFGGRKGNGVFEA